MRECPTCHRCFSDDIERCPSDDVETTSSISGPPLLDNRYELERRLGAGGMGAVFKARHVFLKTYHAIKIILPELVGDDPNMVTRFRQEALAAAAIRHPNIIAVTDFGVVHTMPFLVMEFVQGRSLQELMAEEGPMSPARAYELMRPICNGIGAAHRQNIIHRDLKPLNVMIQEGVPLNEGVKILDFGLAKIKSGELLGSFVAAKTTGLIGSPLYMAPEQWSDEDLDARADVYSLGIILYQMLCGRVPFKGSSVASIMRKHLNDPVPSLASKGAHVSPPIEAFLRRALEKQPKARPVSAEDFISELHAAMVATAQLGDQSAQPTMRSLPTTLTTRPVLTAIQKPSNEAASTRDLHEHEARMKETARSLGEPSLKQAANENIRESAPSPAKFMGKPTRPIGASDERLPKEETARDSVVPSVRETQAIKHVSAQPPPEVFDSELTKIRVTPAVVQTQTRLAETAPGTFSRPDIRPSRRGKLVVGLVAVSVLVLGFIVVGYFALRSRLSQPQAPATVTAPQETLIKPDLVFVPGGTFQMGRDDGPTTEGPAHAVTVSNFFMDKTEVTNAEYSQFVRDTGHVAPKTWSSEQPPDEASQLPVANVSFDDAVAFAEWRSKRDGATYRLPTEEEWEYAARNGSQDNLFPWGNSWIGGRANTEETLAAAAQKVGSYPQGANIWGVEDLIGNVWEWTSSKASLYKGNQSPLPAKHKDWIVIRGGCYSSPTKGALPVSGTLRNWVAQGYKNPQLGFRLVKPAP